MAIRSLQRRLQHAGRRLRDHAYARLAAFWHDGVRPHEEEAAERVFRGLAAWEAAEGTLLEALLSRVPLGLAEAIWRELGATLAAGGADPGRGQAGRSDGRRR